MPEEIIPAHVALPRLRRLGEFREVEGAAKLLDDLEAHDALRDLGAIRDMRSL